MNNLPLHLSVHMITYPCRMGWKLIHLSKRATAIQSLLYLENGDLLKKKNIVYIDTIAQPFVITISNVSGMRW